MPREKGNAVMMIKILTKSRRMRIWFENTLYHQEHQLRSYTLLPFYPNISLLRYTPWISYDHDRNNNNDMIHCPGKKILNFIRTSPYVVTSTASNYWKKEQHSRREATFILEQIILKDVMMCSCILWSRTVCACVCVNSSHEISAHRYLLPSLMMNMLPKTQTDREKKKESRGKWAHLPKRNHVYVWRKEANESTKLISPYVYGSLIQIKMHIVPYKYIYIYSFFVCDVQLAFLVSCSRFCFFAWNSDTYYDTLPPCALKIEFIHFYYEFQNIPSMY